MKAQQPKYQQHNPSNSSNNNDEEIVETMNR